MKKTKQGVRDLNNLGPKKEYVYKLLQFQPGTIPECRCGYCTECYYRDLEEREEQEEQAQREEQSR